MLLPKTDRTWTTTTRISKRFTCHLTLGVQAFTCEWTPGPPRGRLRAGELAAYRRARNALCEQMAADLGLPGSILMLEL
jgi:hypothetical protein